MAKQQSASSFVGKLTDSCSRELSAAASRPGQNCLLWAQGLVMCVGSDRGVIRLYDPRQYEHGPFITFTVRPICIVYFWQAVASTSILNACDADWWLSVS